MCGTTSGTEHCVLSVSFPGGVEERALLLRVLRCFSATVCAEECSSEGGSGSLPEGPALKICCTREGLAEILAVLLQAGCVDFKKIA